MQALKNDGRLVGRFCAPLPRPPARGGVNMQLGTTLSEKALLTVKIGLAS